MGIYLTMPFSLAFHKVKTQSCNKTKNVRYPENVTPKMSGFYAWFLSVAQKRPYNQYFHTNIENELNYVIQKCKPKCWCCAMEGLCV